MRNKYHVNPCLQACGWWKKKYYAENNPKLYSTHQFLSACLQFHKLMFVHPACMH